MKHVYFKRVLVLLLTVLLLPQSGVLAENKFTERLKRYTTEDGLMPVSELPDYWASCFQDVDASTQILLPHVRGSQWREGWQETDTFLPVLLLDDTMTLYFLKKGDDAWHAIRMKEMLSYADFSRNSDINLESIGSFSYWPEFQYDGSSVKGNLSFVYNIVVNNTDYSIHVLYETSTQTSSGWIFSCLQVLPSANGFAVSLESQCFPGVYFENWKVVNIENVLQYQYILNEEINLTFNVETPYSAEDFDLLIMNVQDLLRMPQLCLSTVIDTVKHGNGKSVNLRARPEGKIIAKIPNGTALQFADQHATWGLVQYGELWGFVDARFLAESDAYNYTDTPPSEVLSHMKEHFGAYILEDYIAIDDTPDGDYGFALLSQSAERVLVGYHKNGNKMEYWLKSSNAVPQGEGWVYFQRHSADSIISWGNTNATYSDALGFDVIRIDPDYEEYWSQSVSYHWRNDSFQLYEYMDRSIGTETAYVTDDGLTYHDITMDESLGYVKGTVQRNLQYVSFPALPKTKAQAQERLTVAPSLPR